MTIEIKLRDGEALALAGRKAEAEAVFKEVLDADPGQVRALNNLAVLALAGRRPEEAWAWLERALAADPEDLTTLGNALNFYARQNNWRPARAAASAILARRPEDQKIWRLAARADIGLEDYQAARAKVDRLLAAASPPEPEDLELSAFIRLKSGDRDGAARELTELLARQPHRGDLAVRLALCSKPETAKPRDLWPDPAGRPTLALAETYRRTWADIPTADPALRAAQILGRLHDPLSLSEADLPLAPPPPPSPAGRLKIPDRAADVAGLSIMFAPTVIAGQSAMLANWLNARKAKAVNVEISKSYLAYQADYHYPADRAETPGFIDLMMSKAGKCDFLCLDFGSSFTYFPNFVSRLDWRREKVPGQPYADLRALKDKGVKIIFAFWGSDYQSQSIFPYRYLTQLGFQDLPQPPPQTRFQYHNIMAADEMADIFLAMVLGQDNLPRVSPYHEAVIEPEKWPLKVNYRPRLEKILTAPTNPRKKNYSLIQAALGSFIKRHPEVSPFRVQNTPHGQVPPLYAQADLGLDQAGYSFGTFSVEMMALGLPVICAAPKCGSWRDQAPVLSFSNVRELAARLEEGAADPGRWPELGRRGREYVMEYHTVETAGRFLSHLLAEAAAGGRAPQIKVEGFERCSRIWARDPEKVHNFRFYDVAVPLFCALGEWEYAYYLCLDALDCDWREEKFAAWLKAINEIFKCNIGPYKEVPESEAFTAELARARNMLKNSQALLEEYAGQSAEAGRMKPGAFDWYSPGE
jgi:tetratricopeptide (TPR) repeat protein